MNTSFPSPEVAAAMSLWAELFSFARHSFELGGRGAVLMERGGLLGFEPGGPIPAMNFIAAVDVPAGDDFRPLMLQYDPDRQLVLILGGGGSDEQVLVIEQADSD